MTYLDSHSLLMATWPAGLNKVVILSLSLSLSHTHTHTVYTSMYPTTDVLLLNACLTVKERQPNSHAGRVIAKIKDWEVFDTILQ